MADKDLSSIFAKAAKVGCYLIGSNRISSASSKRDFSSITTGISLFIGVILDYNEQSNIQDRGGHRGRIISGTIAWLSTREVLMEQLLGYLDDVGDAVIAIASDTDGFKLHQLRKEVRAVSVVQELSFIKGWFCAIIDSHSESDDRGAAKLLRTLRQVTSFLKKLDVDRPDLAEKAYADFFDHERRLSRLTPLMARSEEYIRNTFDMKAILMSHLEKFRLTPLRPRHGPGACADVNVKNWYEKHRFINTDRRIGYLLDHAGLATQQDYAPLVRALSSTRTSRFICVPKTWKKLRGISAEPIELQFYQQAINSALDTMFKRDTWWKKRIDLHNQECSRDLARQGSITCSLATIDLSAASDSVTCQLVRDLFGNTELSRWLLGTRSVFTDCNGTITRLTKFAPMGSSTCFPVECIVFTLAAELAVAQTQNAHGKSCCVRVYGDDIILPASAALRLIEILNSIGFTVNAEKSYWTGNFREACGAEYWNGYDIAPCRFRRHVNDLRGRTTDVEEMSAVIAFCNELYERGLHNTRAFYLDKYLDKVVVQMKNKSIRVRDTVFASFSGERQTLASPQPTNFNLVSRYDAGLQTRVYKVARWRERKDRHSPSPELDSDDVCKYVDWLIRHQADSDDDGTTHETPPDLFSRKRLGSVMVPTLKWVQHGDPGDRISV